jgi:hypothetical protein
VISPAIRRQAAEEAQQVLGVSERRVCRVLDQPRATQRYDRDIPDDEEILRARLIALAGCQRQLEMDMATIRNTHLKGTPEWVWELVAARAVGPDNYAGISS